MDLVRWKNGQITLAMNDSKGIELGKIEGVKETAARYVRVRCKAKVAATAAKAGGLSAAQQQAVLGNTSVSFSILHGFAQAHKPLSELPLTRIRQGGMVLLEKEVVGLGAATGLQAPLVIGDNFLIWDSFIPTGHTEFFNQSGLLGGMGDEQLRTCSITLITGAEPLKGGDATVELKEMTYELYPDTQATPPGAQSWAEMAHHDKLVDSDRDEVSTKPGLVLFVGDTAQPLATTAYTKYRVFVGTQMVVEDPSTPATLDAWFASQPDSGTVEASITSQLTPLFRLADSDLNDVRPGAVTIKQLGDKTPFNLSYWYIPVPTQLQVYEALKMMVGRLSSGKVLHAVSKAHVHALKLKDALLPFVGFYAYDEGHVTAKTSPGLRCEYGKEPEVFIPPTMLFKAAQEYAVAKRLGDTGQMTKVVRAIADAIPAAVVSVDGYAGGVSNVARQVVSKLEDAAAAIKFAA